MFENPDEFDMFRFEKLRSKPGNENKYQFATTSLENLAFGHGPHAWLVFFCLFSLENVYIAIRDWKTDILVAFEARGDSLQVMRLR